VQQGAATSVLPVGLPRLEGVGGRYFGGLQRGRDPSTVRTGNLGGAARYTIAMGLNAN